MMPGWKIARAFEADRCDRFFLQSHDAHVPYPALRAAADCGEEREPFDAGLVTSSGEPTDDPELEGLQFLLSPLRGAFPDAPAGGSVDRIAQRDRSDRQLVTSA
jgi:hypothetical protein